jgi:hypothetical protein
VRRARGVLALAIALAAGCAATGPTYVVPAEQPLRGIAPAWTPQAADIARAERGLKPYLRSLGGGVVHDYGHGRLDQRLRDFGRQYVGVMRNGHRVIWINLFATDNPFYERGSERETLIKLHECGDCNAEVYFDVERGSYSDFWESAPLIKQAPR